MNKLVKKFLEVFDLEKMGWQPFILLEYYPSNALGSGSILYMTLGKLHGPVHITFHGEYVKLLSHFRPAAIKYKEANSVFSQQIEVHNDSEAASFRITDMNQCPLEQLGFVMTRTKRACRLIVGREEIQKFLDLLYNPNLREDDWVKRWNSLKKMYEAGLPQTHVHQHDFRRNKVATTA